MSATTSGPATTGLVRTMSTLLATSLLGRLPQAMAALALVRIVLDTGGGYALAGLVTAGYVVASTVGLPALGRLVDRVGAPHLVLLAAAVVSGIALVGLVLATAPALVVGCAVVAGLATPPLEPTLRSIWPRLLSGPGLARAFAADAAAQEVVFIVGPLLVAGALAVVGAGGAVVLMAVLGLAGTALFCLHALARRPAAADGDAARHPSALRWRPVRVLVLGQVLAGLPIGVLTISAAGFAALAGGPALSGVALAVNAGGALCGALLVARFPLRRPPERALRLLLVALAVLYLPTAALGAPPALWLALAFVAGLSLPPLLTQVFAVTGAAVPQGVLTEANAWVVSAFSVGVGAGTFLAGLAVGEWGDGGAVAAVLAASALTLVGAAAARPAVLAPAAS